MNNMNNNKYREVGDPYYEPLLWFMISKVVTLLIFIHSLHYCFHVDIIIILKNLGDYVFHYIQPL